MAVRLLLCDDHAVVREALRALLERAGFDVVAEAADGRAAVRLAAELRPDVALLDLGLPLLSGVEAAREIARESPAVRPLLLTVHAERAYVVEALRAGARGYVLKTEAADDVVRAIEAVCGGGTWVSPCVAAALVEARGGGRGRSAAPLTDREREVLSLVAEGKTTKEIAALLGTSVKTADSHRTRLMRKLDLHETASLVRYAIRTGLVPP